MQTNIHILLDILSIYILFAYESTFDICFTLAQSSLDLGGRQLCASAVATAESSPLTRSTGHGRRLCASTVVTAESSPVTPGHHCAHVTIPVTTDRGCQLCARLSRCRGQGSSSSGENAPRQLCAWMTRLATYLKLLSN